MNGPPALESRKRVGKGRLLFRFFFQRQNLDIPIPNRMSVTLEPEISFKGEIGDLATDANTLPAIGSLKGRRPDRLPSPAYGAG